MNPLVEGCKTEKACLRLARNAERKGRIDIVDEANLRAAQFRQEEYRSAGKRPSIDYHACGLKGGDLIYLPDIDIKVQVYTHRTLLFEGSETYITLIEKELISRGFPNTKIANKWRVLATDEVLNDVYNRVWPK